MLERDLISLIVAARSMSKALQSVNRFAQRADLPWGWLQKRAGASPVPKCVPEGDVFRGIGVSFERKLALGSHSSQFKVERQYQPSRMVAGPRNHERLRSQQLPRTPQPSELIKMKLSQMVLPLDGDSAARMRQSAMRPFPGQPFLMRRSCAASRPRSAILDSISFK